MSRDVITIGSTMRIPLLYSGEYSQWRERFMNYLEEQTDGEAMINSIKNGDKPLPIIAQVSLAGNAHNAPPTLKDLNGEYSQWRERFMNYLEEKTDGEVMINSIQNGLSNDIYSLIDSNETAKGLWDSLERQMRSSDSEYGKQDRKAVILYEYETFKPIKGEQLLDTYLCYLQVINDLKKCGYKKDNCELNYKFLNNLQQEWKQYATLMRQTKNLMDINIDALYNILKQNKGDVNDALVYKKKAVVVTSDPLALVVEKTKVNKQKEKAFNRRNFYSKPTNNNLRTSSTSQSANKKQEFVKTDDKKVKKKADEKKRDMSKVKFYNYKKEGHFAKDCKKAKIKDYNYYKTKMLLAKKDSDEQVLLAEDQAWMESSSDSDHEINANMVFMAQIKKVLSELDEKASSSSADEQISEVLKDQLQVKHVVIDNHVECQKKYAKLEAERYEYMIRYSAYFDNDKQHRKQIADQQVLYDKMSVQLVELDKHVRDLKSTVLEKDFKICELEECVRNKDLEIEKCLKCLNVCENKLHKIGQTNQTVHMIMPSKDNLSNGRKGIGFENPRYFEKAKDLRPTLYDEKVIGLRYTLMFLTHSDEDFKIKKFKRSRENKIKFAYDYGNLNASYVNEKINFEDDYFQEIINPDFEKIDSPFQQTSSLKPYVPNVILENIIIDLEDEVVNLLEKEKVNFETIESLKSKSFELSEKVSSESENQSENECIVVEKECDKEENPKKNKGSSNTSNVGLSAISVSNLNKNVKRYSRKDLLACNNSHLGETSCTSVCDDAMNVSCNSRMNDLLDDNNFFIFDDVNVRISPVSKMPFRKKPRDSMNVHSKNIFSSVRRHKNSGVMWKKKGSSNTSNVGLSAVSVSNLNKNVKRYSRKDLLACNNSHLGDTSSAYMCNDGLNVFCDSRMNDLLDDNNFFNFDDVNVRISPVSKMPFRKKPRDYMNVCSKSTMSKSLPRTVHKWLPKLQPLAEPVAKWFP
nr:hypothetical protein [Tanacetum cinerariifolium]